MSGHSIRITGRIDEDGGPVIVELECSCGQYGPWSYLSPEHARRNFTDHFREAAYPLEAFGFEDAFDRQYPRLLARTYDSVPATK